VCPELDIVSCHDRLHPAAEHTKNFGHRDEEEHEGPEGFGHLPEVVNGNATDLTPEERHGARFDRCLRHLIKQLFNTSFPNKLPT